jgi:hypothetical protein
VQETNDETVHSPRPLRTLGNGLRKASVLVFAQGRLIYQRCPRSTPIASNANQLIWWQLPDWPFNTIANKHHKVCVCGQPQNGAHGFSHTTPDSFCVVNVPLSAEGVHIVVSTILHTACCIHTTPIISFLLFGSCIQCPASAGGSDDLVPRSVLAAARRLNPPAKARVTRVVKAKAANCEIVHGGRLGRSGIGIRRYAKVALRLVSS